MRKVAFLLLVLSAAALAQDERRGVRTLLPLREAARAYLATEEGNALPVKCGLPTVTAALQHRHELGPERVKALARVMFRPAMQTSIAAGGFRVHFDTTGNDAPAILNASGQRIEGTARRFADSVMASLVYSASVEVGGLGYDPPPGDGGLGGGPEYDLYLADLGNMYGYTTPDTGTVEGGRSTTFIFMDNDFTFATPAANKGLPAMRVTVAHEYHHAIQIGAYGYWTSDVFYYEMTSVWLEDVVYPDVNDYLNYVSTSWPYSHFVVPDKAFDTYDLTMYSRAIWGHYVAKRFGTLAMRRCWEQIRGSRPIRAIDIALQSYGSGFSAAYSEWMLWNYFTGSRADTATYYPEGNRYPLISMVPASFEPPQTTRTIPGNLSNLAGRYHDVRRLLDTLVLAVSYVSLGAWAQGTGSSQDYTYTLTTQGGGTGYTYVGAGIYVKLDAPDQAAWHSLALLNGDLTGEVGLPETPVGITFPSPYLANGFTSVNITIPAAGSSAGTLYIYSSNMDLVSSAQVSTLLVGRLQCVQWDGKTRTGSGAPTGIYLYHLVYTDPVSGSQRTQDGKIALIRQ
jgi:hypothetical protein